MAAAAAESRPMGARRPQPSGQWERVILMTLVFIREMLALLKPKLRLRGRSLGEVPGCSPGCPRPRPRREPGASPAPPAQGGLWDPVPPGAAVMELPSHLRRPAL